MNKEQIKRYLEEAIDAMDEEAIESIFSDRNEPDLYTIATELVSIKGEMKKLSNSTLTLNNNIKSIAENIDNDAATKKNVNDESLNQEIMLLLNQIIDQDDLMSRTAENFRELPKLDFFSLSRFKRNFEVWQKGFEITMEKWDQLVKTTGLYKTGKKGQKFDPSFHEAIAVTTDAATLNNVIVEIEVEGYIYKQHPIRQAKVIVNKNSK